MSSSSIRSPNGVNSSSPSHSSVDSIHPPISSPSLDDEMVQPMHQTNDSNSPNRSSNGASIQDNMAKFYGVIPITPIDPPDNPTAADSTSTFASSSSMPMSTHPSSNENSLPTTPLAFGLADHMNEPMMAHLQLPMQQHENLSPQMASNKSHAVMPSHRPPPPPLASSSSQSASNSSNDSISPMPHPSVNPSSSSSVSPPPISPKTSKLLRRIHRMQQELEELQLENEVLKEANRRANEERIVRDQEKRLDQKKRADHDAEQERELERLKAELHRLTHDADENRHDPTECARTIADLTEMLTLREEQLELINLDRSKLYEEIETWKIGMEKLASLQQHGADGSVDSRRRKSGVTLSGSPSGPPLPSPVDVTTPVSSFAAVTTRPTSDNNLISSSPFTPAPLPLDEAGLFFARSTSEFKSDADESKLASTSGHTGPIAAPPVPMDVQTRGRVDADGTVSTEVEPFAIGGASSSSSSSSDFVGVVEEEIWQNQRFDPFFGFQATSKPFMRPTLSDESGNIEKRFEDVVLPPGWIWEEPWSIDKSEWVDLNATTGNMQRRVSDAEGEGEGEGEGDDESEVDLDQANGRPVDRLTSLRRRLGLRTKSSKSDPSSSTVGTDADGWRYSIQFKLFAWHETRGRLDTVRRRRWKRRRCFVGVQATEAMLENALKAIEEMGGPQALQAVAEQEDEDADAIDANATPNNGSAKPTLASLAAAYSSGSSGEAFSMFTSVAPAEVTGGATNHSSTNSTTRNLQALLQLMKSKDDAIGAQAQTPAKTKSQSIDLTSSSPNPTLGPISTSLTASPTSTPTPVAPSSSSASSSGGGGMIAGLSSFITNSRVASWVGRRSSNTPNAAADPSSSSVPPLTIHPIGSPTEPTEPLPDTPLSANNLDSPVAAPSPVCSFCTAPSKAALQYVNPETSMLLPVTSWCHQHYHQAWRCLLLELQAHNPDPLTPAQIEARMQAGGNNSICAYCDALETFPVRLLHLLVRPSSPGVSSHAPVTDSTTTASASASAGSTPSSPPPPTCRVLDVNDAFRFCAKHMTPFIEFVQAFKPNDNITTSGDANLANEMNGDDSVNVPSAPEQAQNESDPNVQSQANAPTTPRAPSQAETSESVTNNSSVFDSPPSPSAPEFEALQD